MSDILPVDLPNLFLGEILANQREPDGLLHCSSDLRAPLRFVQLRAVGAPSNPRPIAQDIRLAHGTLWHDWFHNVIERSGIKFKYELNLNEYLPEGWGGTADWLFWNPVYEAWVLGDLKTTKGEGMFFIERDGAKSDHIWQLSAYWHALARMGIPLVKGFGIMYWPMNDTADTVDVTPLVQECQPIDADILHSTMEAIRASVDNYRTVFAETGKYINPALASMPEREQKYYWNKAQMCFDVKMVPVWYERFCEFKEELCPRSKSEKIGHYTLNGVYIPRRGYEATIPEVEPTQADYNKRR